MFIIYIFYRPGQISNFRAMRRRKSLLIWDLGNKKSYLHTSPIWWGKLTTAGARPGWGGGRLKLFLSKALFRIRIRIEFAPWIRLRLRKADPDTDRATEKLVSNAGIVLVAANMTYPGNLKAQK